MRVAVLADTHAPRRWRSCPPRVAEHLRAVDLILHAGDVCTAAVLAELAAFAPVRAVHGNNDGLDVREWGAPETLTMDLDGLEVAMIHDSGAARGRTRRMRRRFPTADLVVFGHSHIPMTRPATVFASSTQARPPTGGASRAARSACSTSATTGSSRRG